MSAMIDPTILTLGLVNSYLGMESQNRMLNKQREMGNRFLEMGAELERSELSLQMEAARLNSMDESIANTERLRSVLASQNVLAATRGQKTGAGSARAASSAANRAYARDESSRQTALNFKQLNFQNQQRISEVNQIGSRYSLETGISSQKQDALNAFSDKAFNALGGVANSLFATGGGSAPVEKREAAPTRNSDSYGRKRTRA